MYGVEVKALNQAVKRSGGRFPEDFMFRLTSLEHASLRSQTVTLKKGRGHHRKYLPLALTEQGVAMLSSVLRSGRAVQMNVEIIRAFVRLRADVGPIRARVFSTRRRSHPPASRPDDDRGGDEQELPSRRAAW